MQVHSKKFYTNTIFPGDHALIDISKIISMNPRHVTVRTKSKENQSCDSNSTPIPATALKAKHSTKVRVKLFSILAYFHSNSTE